MGKQGSILRVNGERKRYCVRCKGVIKPGDGYYGFPSEGAVCAACEDKRMKDLLKKASE